MQLVDFWITKWYKLDYLQYILLYKFGDKLGLNLEKENGFDTAYSGVLGSLHERAAQLFCIKRELDVILK